MVVAASVPHHTDNMYHPFMFMHHAGTAWECAVMLDKDGKRVEVNGVPVYEILPSLRKFKIRPGVHGIRQGKHDGDGADWLGTRTRRESEGWVFIAPNALSGSVQAFGEPVPGGYVVQYNGQRGTIYADAWSAPVMRPGAKKITWIADNTGFAMFRRALIKQAIIAPPDRMVVDALIRVQEQRAGRRITDVHIPAVAVRVEAENVKLMALRTIADKVDNGLDADSRPATAAGKRGKAPGRVAPSPMAAARASAAVPLDGPDDDE